MSKTISTTNGGTEARDVSTRVVDAIADRKNVDPIDLPPLYPEVDLDALDSFFASSGSQTAPFAGRVTFTAFGYEVVVEGPERVTVTPATADPEPMLVE